MFVAALALTPVSGCNCQCEIEAGLQPFFAFFVESVQTLAEKFLQAKAAPVDAHRFEIDLEKIVRESARLVVEWCFGVSRLKKSRICQVRLSSATQ